MVARTWRLEARRAGELEAKVEKLDVEGERAKEELDQARSDLRRHVATHKQEAAEAKSRFESEASDLRGKVCLF